MSAGSGSWSPTAAAIRCRRCAGPFKSLRAPASQLGEFGHKISRTVVGELLKAKGFSLHANRKTKERSDHPDRDAQFAVISQATKEALAERRPVISVNTKKKGERRKRSKVSPRESGMIEVWARGPFAV